MTLPTKPQIASKAIELETERDALVKGTMQAVLNDTASHFGITVALVREAIEETQVTWGAG